MGRRRSWIVLVVCVAGAVAIGASWYRAVRRHRAALAQADREMAAGRYGAARVRLIGLRTRWNGAEEVDYRLGVCEAALGHGEAALAAWGRLPADSRFAEAAALNSAAVELNRGRFAAAEPILARALEHPGPQVVTVHHLLGRILWQEGRLDEMRAPIESGWRLASRPGRPHPEEALGLLRSHIALDFESLAVDTFRTLIERAGEQAPDDDRVWLARANLALRDGRSSEARRWLDDCLARRPEDPSVWRAVLDWAMGAGRDVEFRRALAHLPTGWFRTSRVAALRAWLASRRGDADAERRALEKAVGDEPGDCAAWERLAVLATEAGQVEPARRLRHRKAEMDRARQRYRDLYNRNLLADDAPEFARLAEALGRRFEAVGFQTWIAQQNPGDRDAAAALARLQVAEAKSGEAGPTLAQVLAADLGSGPGRTRSGPAIRPPDAAPPEFRDDATAAGLTFAYENGESSLHQLPEFAGGGVGLLDYDGDGRLDIYLVQGGPFPPGPARSRCGDRLFRNRGDGTFRDVTDAAGIGAFAGGYGQGVAVADYDNDGHPDLFVTRWRSYALYRNRGDGTFEDVTGPAGFSGDRDWPTSAAFADLDNDGDLDLYVCHYLRWETDDPRICYDAPPNRRIIGCNPREFEALPDHVFRNDRGRFTDVTASAGLHEQQGRGLGVVAADLDGDGRVDLFVANDQSANFLYRNLGDFRFEETAEAAGVAAGAEGGYQAGMGVACGDLDGDGLLDLAVTNFYGESTSFFHNLGRGLFADRTAAVGLAAPSRHRLGFGVAFLDADDDGRLDLLTANGHVNDYRPSLPYAMPLQLLQGLDDGRLRDVSDRAGPPFEVPHLGRGLAVGDLDNDGRLDAMVVAQNEPVVYLHNRTAGGHFLTIDLAGTASNRDAVGARVAVEAGGRRGVAHRLGGGSYLSAGDGRLHFGLGRATRVDRVEVRWPSGRVDVFRDLDADTAYRLREADPSPRPIWKGHRGDRPHSPLEPLQRAQAADQAVQGRPHLSEPRP